MVDLSKSICEVFILQKYKYFRQLKLEITLAYLVISTNPEPTIYRNLYEYTSPDTHVRLVARVLLDISQATFKLNKVYLTLKALN